MLADFIHQNLYLRELVMKIKVDYSYTQRFLPSKRHRKLRFREMKDTMVIDIKELTVDEFPIAFIVHDMLSVYDGAKSYDDFVDGKSEYKMFAEEIRTYKGQLRKPVRITHGAAISTLFENYSYIIKNIEHWLRLTELNDINSFPFTDNSDEFNENSIIVNDNKEEIKKHIRNMTKSYIYCDGKFWSVCGEPRYDITTFGLGHNHGGTGFFITEFYNENIPAKNYFNALQRGKAIAYGKSVALNRGDTESVDKIGEFCNIEVLMPELVKVKPNEQHGEGNKFLNDMEDIVESSNDSLTAGLLCMSLACKEL